MKLIFILILISLALGNTDILDTVKKALDKVPKLVQNEKEILEKIKKAKELLSTNPEDAIKELEMVVEKHKSKVAMYELGKIYQVNFSKLTFRLVNIKNLILFYLKNG